MMHSCQTSTLPSGLISTPSAPRNSSSSITQNIVFCHVPYHSSSCTTSSARLTRGLTQTLPTKFRTTQPPSPSKTRCPEIFRTSYQLPTQKRHVATRAYISPPAPAYDIDGDRGNGSDSSFPYDVEVRTEIAGSSRPEPEAVVTWRLVLGLVWKEKLLLARAAASLIVGTSCTLIMPRFTGAFFETLIGKRTEPLPRLLGTLAFIYLLEPLVTISYVTSLITAWERVMAQLRALVFERLLVQQVEFFDRHKVGELTALLASELAAVEKVVSENVSRDRGFRALSEVLGTLTILWYLSRDLAPAFAFLMIAVSTGVALYKRTTAPVFRMHAKTQAKIFECANETFGAIRTVRSFGGESRQLGAFEGQVAASRASGTQLGWLKSYNEAWTRIAVYVSLLAVYWLGGAKVKAGLLPVGTMVSFIGYTFTMTFAVQGLVNTLADLRSVFAAVGRINEVTSETAVDSSLALGLEREARGEIETCKDPPALTPSSPGVSVPAEQKLSSVCELAWAGDVMLEGVSFSYPQRGDIEILKGIDLRLTRGSVTALVGASGAGKSTVVQLLSRFYEPTSGVISLAGQDVRLYDKSEWARAVSLVNQEPVLFALSLRENIAYGLPNDRVSEEEVIAAAKAANAHEFIEKLPQGYDTMVGERGSLLSGGQRQRIAIARALLKNSPILILDEATSALDSVSERLVQDALERLMKGRTTLVIAHRLSTVQSADQIAVMAHGHIIELGTHSTLVAKGGSYAELVNSQRLSFE